MTQASVLLLTAAIVHGCATGDQVGSAKKQAHSTIKIPPIFTVIADSGVAEAESQKMERRVRSGMKKTAKFFGIPYQRPFRVFIFSDRVRLDAFWRARWKQPSFRSKCWMVASGSEDTLAILSPKAWQRDACDHDPEGEGHIQRLVTHELVHVHHDQLNPANGFEGFEPIGWFVEGLATFVSGQLDDGHRASPLEAIKLQKEPKSLANAWSGKYRYGVCGSIVKFLEHRGGRSLLKRLIRKTTAAGVYGAIGLDDQQLLGEWRSWLTSGDNETTKK
jgi:hypothetical protein